MYNIKLTDEFDVWLNGLKDNITRLRLARRLDKASRGALGDVRSVGEGVFEMREHFGAGWRLYYVQQDDTLIIMLAGGDKSSQRRDIARAKQIAINLNEVRP